RALVETLVVDLAARADDVRAVERVQDKPGIEIKISLRLDKQAIGLVRRYLRRESADSDEHIPAVHRAAEDEVTVGRQEKHPITGQQVGVAQSATEGKCSRTVAE